MHTCVLEYRTAEDRFETIFTLDYTDPLHEWLGAEGLHVARGQP